MSLNELDRIRIARAAERGQARAIEKERAASGNPQRSDTRDNGSLAARRWQPRPALRDDLEVRPSLFDDDRRERDG
jgi:hypothetical protein